FIGLQGIVVKSHGSAGPDGIKSAIRRAMTDVQENLPERLSGRIRHLLP
ncbi:phosphate acyltransferase, partial [Pseudomonas sp. CrR14]|nr:phosphate acyltransferase [Pseudomonas sp. CrR14]